MIRSSHLARRLVAFGLVGALAACSGGGGSHVSPAAGTGSGGTSTPSGHLVSTLVLPSIMKNVSQGSAATDIPGMAINVVVNLQNAQGLADYARGANDPTDGRYRQFLTATQIGDMFGATRDNYAAVANYFASYGLKVGGYPQRLALTVAGPRSGFEKALGVAFSHYKTPEGNDVLAPGGAVHFAKPLPISSLANAIQDPQAMHVQYVRGGSVGPNTTGYAPQQVATAFDYTGAYADGFTGAGINLGIIGTGPYSAADFTAYRASYGLPGSSTIRVVPGNSASAANAGSSPAASPPPVTPPCTGKSYPNAPSGSVSPTATCNPEDGETQIDTQQSASLARDANILYYLTYIPIECNDPTVSSCPANPSTGLGYAYQGLYESDDEIQQAIADNDGQATNGPDILSLSYGGPERLNIGEDSNPANGLYDPTALEPSEFAALAAEGVAVFVSSGDQGANICARYSLSFDNTPCVSYPSGDQNVTSVGGVTIGLNAAGDLLGPITAWGRQTSSGGGSGGGVSTIVPAPGYQHGPNVSTTFRSQPDASLLGDPATSVATFTNFAFSSKEVVGYGGTSVAAPQMAAMWALVLQACKQTASCARATGPKTYRLGNAAPYFYSIYNDATKYPATFLDVTFGNTGLAGCEVRGSCAPGSATPPPAASNIAGTGYDLTTGIGVPFARHLIRSVVGI